MQNLAEAVVLSADATANDYRVGHGRMICFVFIPNTFSNETVLSLTRFSITVLTVPSIAVLIMSSRVLEVK